MKKICFPATSKIHLARQQLLLKELNKHFEVDVWILKEENGGMAINSIFYAIQFNNYLIKNNFDYALIRGDRYELLFLTAICAYRGIKIIHLEAGDVSGVIDNKIRNAISYLADYHFATNNEALRRLINMGLPMDKVWNYGSLDVEYASKVKPKKKIRNKSYIFVPYHAIEDEDEEEIKKALGNFKNYAIIRVKGNADYNKEYPAETYSPEDYINLMRYASVCVGNSSSLLKEASVLGVGVVLIGDRQYARLPPKNVVQVPCQKDNILKAISYQMQNKYEKDLTYYQSQTSVKITKKLKEIL